MSDNDQDKISQEDSSDADDLASLSSEEKAAFEKIMAEISAATGEAPAAEAPKAASPSQSEPSASDTPSPSPVEGAKSAPNMDGDSSSEDNCDDPDDDSDALSDDQQEALDKIMAEIDSKRKSEKEEPPPEAESQADNEPLSDDQQDALNQIMAQIDSKRNIDRTTDGDTPEPPNDDKSETDDEPLAADQQAALDKIMSDIQAKKNRPDMTEHASEEDSETSPQEAGNEGERPNSENLTLDEFDSELNNLLLSEKNAAHANPEEQTSPETHGTANAEETETMLQDLPPVLDNPDESATARATGTLDPEQITGNRGPVLREVTIDVPDPPSRNGFLKGSPQKVLRRVMIGMVMIFAALGLSVMALGGHAAYFKIQQWRHPDTDAPPSVSLSNLEKTPGGRSALSGQPIAEDEPHQIQPNGVQDETGDLGSWTSGLITARKRIQRKIYEIQSLKEYYRNGIDEDIQKMEPLITQGIPAFNEAMTHKPIELTVRSVQRRTIYIARLEVPLTTLGAMAEELLFLERRAQLHDTLSQGISGLPRMDLQNQITQALEDYNQYSTALSIDEIEVDAPDLESIWREVVSRLSRKAQQLSTQSPLNKAISAEICKGSFERKFMLTALSSETARCLINWTGKDLYLNELTELTAETAGVLVQWPGEWLSLNGLKTLSADTAKHLARWPGKRLSLNGLTILSAETTSNLSQWKGEQLEMVGLQAIGSWENYGTRLFLSENLRRQLDIQ